MEGWVLAWKYPMVSGLHIAQSKVVAVVRTEMIRAIKQFWFFLERVPPCLIASFSRQGFFSAEGRILIWGKFRRFILTLFPPLATHLQSKYGLVGECVSCGASCKLLFQCPHWDDHSNLCTVYEDRPNICRHFPITPSDLRDRDIVLRKSPCGFAFTKKLSPQHGTGVVAEPALAAFPLNRPRNDIED